MSACIRRPIPQGRLAAMKSLAPRRLSALSSSRMSSSSTYFVQSFRNTDEQYILLLPRASSAMGRISLSKSSLPTSFTTHGPTVEFIGPISPETIKENWSTFVENAGFRDLLQSVVKENIAKEEVVINDAKALQGGEGWIHLCDERQLPVVGRIPETEDIIGSVLVREHKILPETYQAMPTYRLVTPMGPMKLSAFLLEKLRERLKET